MATPGELVAAVSKLLGVPQPTVAQHDRNLVVAGLRSKSGRGRSAPKVTPRDAAHLLAAVMGSVMVKDSAEVVERFRITKSMNLTSLEKPRSDVFLPVDFFKGA